MNEEGHEIIDRILVSQVEGKINISFPAIVKFQEFFCSPLMGKLGHFLKVLKWTSN